jgi:hypothetical protein
VPSVVFQRSPPVAAGSRQSAAVPRAEQQRAGRTLGAAPAAGAAAGPWGTYRLSDAGRRQSAVAEDVDDACGQDTGPSCRPGGKHMQQRPAVRGSATFLTVSRDQRAQAAAGGRGGCGDTQDVHGVTPPQQTALGSRGAPAPQ